ncbi:MAG: phenylalanine--tRNA ligase subunit beta, partial [Hyphomicrobiales bacterium]|nr:phenylalanine--tRNA ligase subunit beta [Hyphomicrobiales bacterium]
MKFTLGWLKDHLDTTASLGEIAATLTRVGLEVERIGDPAAKLKGFVVARVLDAKPHPNADRLRVCVVDFGAAAPAQVVCGAPNARSGMTGVFSPAGTFIPGKGITLAKGVIRGVESEGMLCSGAELEISDDHDGILDLPADAPVGMAYAAYAGLDDPTIEINLTPNRPDAAGVAGIARDLAAAGLGTLKTKDAAALAGAIPCPTPVKLDFTAADARLCPAFALRLVRGLRNGPSPEWMRRRLTAIGMRPINALVDVTNYLTFDRGRPLHVFDAAKVKGALVVRRAAAGETLLCLDGKERALDPSIVVIADDAGVESIAGVMGGERTGCDEGTTDVLIESALWDPLSIAQAGRKLGIVTDARYRFERGVDPAFCLPGLDLATRLVISTCGGEHSRVELAGAIDATRAAFPFPWSETRRLTGVDVPADEARDILRRLGFGVGDGEETALVTVPTWRPDVAAKADVVEEIVRIAGLDRVTSRPLPRPGQGPIASPLTLLQKRVRAARRALAAQGLDEAVTWSFVSADRARAFGGGKPELALANPIAAELSDMRPSLAPGLIAAAGRNASRGFGD